MTKIRSLLVVFTFCLLAILSFARTAQEDQKATQERALAEVQKRLAGHEDEPAEKVFANIQILKGKKASRLPGMMSALTGLLGVDCSHCHVPGKWASEEKAAKQTTRQHFAMQGELNQKYFGGGNNITCWTCHRGQPKAESLPQTGK